MRRAEEATMRIERGLAVAVAIALASGPARADDEIGAPRSALTPPAWKGCKTDRKSQVTGPAATIACWADTSTPLVTWAYWHEERGDDGPLTHAAVVAACDVLITDKHFYYLFYRLCRIEADQVDHAKVAAALDAAGIGGDDAKTILERYDRGAARIEGLADKVAQHVKGYPGDPSWFDDSLAQAQVLHTAFDQWLPIFDGLDAWVASLAGGPGFADGCAAPLQKLLDTYLDATVTKASGDALLDAVHGPIGFHLSEALGICYAQTGDEWHARVFGQEYLAHAHRVIGWHDAFVYILAANAWPKAKWKGKALSGAEITRMDAAPRPDDDKAWKYLDPYSANGQIIEDDVGSVKKAGDQLVVTFAVHKGTAVDSVGCRPDYSHVASIDENGTFHYDLIGCHTEAYATSSQEHPVSLPLAEAGAVKAGTRIRTLRVTTEKWDEKKPSKVVLVWVERGKDVVWAAGHAVR
jgi:hypothetical protein